MTRNLASELAPRRIRVNQVTPGATRTPIWSPMAGTPDGMAALEKDFHAAFRSAGWVKRKSWRKAALFLASRRFVERDGCRDRGGRRHDRRAERRTDLSRLMA